MNAEMGKFCGSGLTKHDYHYLGVIFCNYLWILDKRVLIIPSTK